MQPPIKFVACCAWVGVFLNSYLFRSAAAGGPLAHVQPVAPHLHSRVHSTQETPHKHLISNLVR